MEKPERMLLSDAIRTAIEGEIRLYKLKVGISIACGLNAALLGCIAYLIWRLYG